MDTPDGSPVLRIGELSRRLGVSDHVLRAWESRYGLLQPVRSAGGFRLYSEADVLRVRRMQAHLARGLSAAEAARAVLGEDNGAGHGRAAGPHPAVPAASELPGDLRQALDAFDEPAAQAALDRLVSDLSRRREGWDQYGKVCRPRTQGIHRSRDKVNRSLHRPTLHNPVGWRDEVGAIKNLELDDVFDQIGSLDGGLIA